MPILGDARRRPLLVAGCCLLAMSVCASVCVSASVAALGIGIGIGIGTSPFIPLLLPCAVCALCSCVSYARNISIFHMNVPLSSPLLCLHTNVGRQAVHSRMFCSASSIGSQTRLKKSGKKEMPIKNNSWEKKKSRGPHQADGRDGRGA